MSYMNEWLDFEFGGAWGNMEEVLGRIFGIGLNLG
jgi:hypothetical protein